MDGVAGARNDLAFAPSADIANGAPTGADATNQIVLTWADGAQGLNHEQLLLMTSTDGGARSAGRRGAAHHRRPAVLHRAGDLT